MTIFKEKLAKSHTGRRLIAGDAAEKQLAFYLNRAFGEVEDIIVLNDLRIMRGSDVAQMDHLIIHRSGAIIVESKSVSTRVKVNVAGEWERWYDGRWQGMPSPVAQARRQADLLLKLLDANFECLLGKVAGLLQKRFGSFDVSVVVAVSENGSIDREKLEIAPEATKADLVCDKVKQVIARQRKATGIKAAAFGKTSDFRMGLTENEFCNVCRFLKDAHVEREGMAMQTPSIPNQPTVSDVNSRPEQLSPASVHEKAEARLACTKCESPKGDIQYGKFGYYWKCKDCDGNSKLILPGGGKLRKDGKKFFLCASDGVETAFHENA